MDGCRFDDLIRRFATSRRGALRTLAGIAAGGLVALLDPVPGDAQRRPRRPRPPRRNRNRPGICAGRRDFARCGGECGRCMGGLCIPDHASCLECDFCDAGTLMCIPIAEGQTCGNSGCSTCQGGVCLPAGEGEECGDCGVCRGGQCRGDGQSCADPDCQVCDGATGLCVQLADDTTCRGDCGRCQAGACAANNEGGVCGNCGVCQGFECVAEGCGECGVCENDECRLPDDDPCGDDCALCIQSGRNFTCIQANDGSNCGACGTCRGGACRENDCGECGRCENGTCVPDESRCDDECELCDEESLTCDPTITEGLRCGLDCGVCRDGACMAETAECPDPACQICNPETRACEARPDFTVCRGECAVCQGGACVAGGCEEPECRVCNATTGTCEAINEGLPCGETGTCQDGACVEQGACPPGLRRCGSCCYDDRSPVCEACEVVSDPSSPNGFGFECISTIPRMTERCADLGEQFGIGLGFNPAVTCGACCALPGEPCFTQTARYLCCSGGTCERDPTTNTFICP